MQLSLRFYVECNKIFKCTINKLCVYSPKKCGSAFIFAWNAISLPLFCVASNYISDRALWSTAVSMEKYFQFKMFLASRPTKWYPLCRFNCCPAQVCLIFCDRCKLLHNREHFNFEYSAVSITKCEKCLGGVSPAWEFCLLWIYWNCWDASLEKQFVNYSQVWLHRNLPNNPILLNRIYITDTLCSPTWKFPTSQRSEKMWSTPGI